MILTVLEYTLRNSLHKTKGCDNLLTGYEVCWYHVVNANKCEKGAASYRNPVMLHLLSKHHQWGHYLTKT